MKTKYILTALPLIALLACAQVDSLRGDTEYRYSDLMQTWRNTENSAALTIEPTDNRGVASIGYYHKGGDYHRVQEGEQSNSMKFFTERYQQMGKYLYGYGKFRFDIGRTQERVWGDQYRLYNAIPFISGSSIPGKYDHQDFELTAKVGTKSFNGWRFGVALDYNLGDLSRLRDPRSRSRLLEYKLTPSVSYSFDNDDTHTIGLSGHYNRRKEKMGSLTTVQNDANLMYYLMSGMEVADGTIGGYSSFNREWVNHNFGAEVQYGYKNDAFTSTSAVSIEHGTEYIYGNYKYEPGRYYTYLYNIASQNRIKTDRLIHQIDVKVDFQQAYANEYRQQLVITNDATTGLTSYRYDTQFEFKKRYQVETMDLNFRYRANLIRLNESNNARQVKAYLGLAGNLSSQRNTHLLNKSESKYGRFNLQTEDGVSLFNNRLTLDFVLGYSFATKSELNLADPTTDYAKSVLIPDFRYYDANVFHTQLQVMYQFPLSIREVRGMWYIKANGGFQSANNEERQKGYNFGISIGVFN